MFGTKIKITLILSISLGLITCSKMTSLQNSSLSAELVGLWIGTCTQDSSTSLYSKERFIINNEFITFAQDIYGTSTTCNSSSLLYTLQLVMSYEIKEEYTGITGSRKIDEVTLRYEYIAQTSAAAQTLTTQGYCGISNWIQGVAQNITGRTCSGQTMPNPGNSIFDIYQISENVLRFGEGDSSHDYSSDSKRPIALSSQTYTRQ